VGRRVQLLYHILLYHQEVHWGLNCAHVVLVKLLAHRLRTYVLEEGAGFDVIVESVQDVPTLLLPNNSELVVGEVVNFNLVDKLLSSTYFFELLLVRPVAVVDSLVALALIRGCLLLVKSILHCKVKFDHV
jgi:uncharacterized protein (DUF983 family)